MLLAIDIGNTNVVFGFFIKGKLVQTKRISSTISRTEDELWIVLKEFLAQVKTSPESMEGVVISSVVSELNEIFINTVKENFKITPLFINSMMDLGFKIPYDDPTTLGADRICNVFAVIKKFGGPAIIVDFGTATTYDIITNKCEYLGGVIAPGLKMSAIGLFQQTSKLPKVELKFPETIIGKNTVRAIQSGVMYGAIDAFEGMVKRLRRVVGKYAIVVATGGYASIIAEMTNEIKYLEPNLVLEGERLIYEHVKKKSKR
jgi:type III pantothenate kinase